MAEPAPELGAARRLLRRAPLVDGHNDLPWEMRTRFGYDLERLDLAQESDRTHTDIPRLRRGGVGAQFWSVYVPSAWPPGPAVIGTLEQIDFVRRMVRRYPADLELTTSAAGILSAFRAGRVACLMGAEGGQSIGGSLAVLRILFELGVGYLTLTHNDNLPWADSATDQPGVGGLSPFGVEVVRQMQRLGMLVDLSHVAESTMGAALDASRAPVIFSHSAARSLCDHPRNVPDRVLARLNENGGLCMVTFVPQFISPACREWGLELRAEVRARGLRPDLPEDRAVIAREWLSLHPAPRARLTEVADHVEHVRDVVGVAHVGLGGDYDGTDQTPVGLEDVSAYPRLIAELLERGWSEDDCLALAGGNLLRVMGRAEEVAAELGAREQPSLAGWPGTPE